MSMIAKRNRATNMALVTGEIRPCMVPQWGHEGGTVMRAVLAATSTCGEAP